jgi:imidazolonepropionase-like amidohydrolase
MKRLAILCFTAVALPFALRADTPNVFAIRGARIVTAAGAPIDAGTIVIRRGTIDAVGASIAVPADATVIDGAGMTVYPGLIDLGNTRASDQAIPATPQNVRTTAELERWKRMQILKPQTRAADTVRVDDAELTRIASAGITSVLALPGGDVISGQSALVNVAAPPDEPQIGNIVDQRRGLIVVKTPVAVHVSFPNQPRAGGNAYPNSLMGVIAFVRQAFLDAQHFKVAKVDDPAMEALQPAIDGKVPVAFEANQSREILRALNLARELKLQPIVTGGRNAGEVAADLSRRTCASSQLNFRSARATCT